MKSRIKNTIRELIRSIKMWEIWPDWIWQRLDDLQDWFD